MSTTTAQHDPSSWSSEELLADTRAFNERLREALAGLPASHEIGAAATRAARLEGRGANPPPVYLPQGQDRTVPGRAGPVGIRVFVPETVHGVYLYIHGGGWVLGAANQQDPLLWRIAQEASVAVVSVEYRLAPEDPYPAGPDDCEDAALWLVQHARDEFGSDRLVIGGGSAGAHLAVVTLLRLRDRHGIEGAFSGADLLFGVYDLTMTPSQELRGTDSLILSTTLMAWFYDCFVPGTDHARRRDADVSPLYADLAGMPAARFAVGTADPLLDDTLFMAARWKSAGRPCELAVIEEAVHGFHAQPTGAAELSRRAEIDFLRGCVL